MLDAKRGDESHPPKRSKGVHSVMGAFIPKIPSCSEYTNNLHTDYLAIFNISPLSLHICSTCWMISSDGKDKVSIDDQVMYCPGETFSSADFSVSTPSRTVSVDLISSKVFSRFVPTSKENFH